MQGVTGQLMAPGFGVDQTLDRETDCIRRRVATLINPVWVKDFLEFTIKTPFKCELCQAAPIALKGDTLMHVYFRSIYHAVDTHLPLIPTLRKFYTNKKYIKNEILKESFGSHFLKKKNANGNTYKDLKNSFKTKEVQLVFTSAEKMSDIVDFLLKVEEITKILRGKKKGIYRFYRYFLGYRANATKQLYKPKDTFLDVVMRKLSQVDHKDVITCAFYQILIKFFIDLASENSHFGGARFLADSTVPEVILGSNYPGLTKIKTWLKEALEAQDEEVVYIDADPLNLFKNNRKVID